MNSRYAQVLNLVVDVFEAEGWSEVAGETRSIADRISSSADPTGSVESAVNDLSKSFLSTNRLTREEVRNVLVARVSKARLARAVTDGTTTIVNAGANANVAVNSPGAVQSIRANIKVGDEGSLRDGLLALGADRKRVDRLVALAAEKAEDPVEAGQELREKDSRISRAARKVAISIALASKDFTIATAGAMVGGYLLTFWGH